MTPAQPLTNDARPLLSVRGLTVRHAESPIPALRGISFDLFAGNCLCVSGASGSGKTTLLLALKGLAGGSTEGEMFFEGGGESARIVFQNAQNQLLCPTVAEEAAFGPENLCLTKLEVGQAVDRALRAVGLRELWATPCHLLSAGQQHRASIAAALSMSPRLLLLDEPLAQLDAPSKKAVVDIIAELKKRGHAVLVAEHEWEALGPVVDSFLYLVGGEVSEHPPARARSWTPRVASAPASLEEQPVLEALGMEVAHPGGPLLYSGDFKVRRGERVHLFGENGSGKSSLLRALACVENLRAGTISCGGEKVSRAEELLGRVGYLLQNPERQIFEVSVREEVAFTLRRLGMTPEEVKERVESTLALCSIPHLAERSPHVLSYGETHRVALAAVLAPSPSVLLLDEPFSGLDFELRNRLLDLLVEISDRGTAVVLASHDAEPYGRWADRVVSLSGGEGG